MRNDTVVQFRKKDEVVDPLTQLLREGAQKLIHQAVSAELEIFLEHHRERRDENGRRAVVRNGYLPQREVLTGIGPVTVQVPKVRWRGVLSIRLGAAVCAARAQRGGGAAVAVSEGGFHRQHAGGADGLAGRTGAGPVGAGDLAAEGRLDQGV